MLTKDAAICIRALDYSETSQILTFFTKLTGKIDAIAKGSKHPKSAFAGVVEIFSYGRIVFSQHAEKKLATLTEFEQQPSFSHLSKNLLALNCSLFAAELLNSLTDDYDPHPELFDHFLKFLHNTQDTSHQSRDTISLFILFQLALLKEIGLQPILNACANCKTKYEMRDTRSEIYFSSLANGLICRDCEASHPDKVRLTKPAADSLSNLKLIAKTSEKTLNEIEKILIYHFTEIMHRQPKMAKHILQSESVK